MADLQAVFVIFLSEYSSGWQQESSKNRGKAGGIELLRCLKVLRSLDEGMNKKQQCRSREEEAWGHGGMGMGAWGCGGCGEESGVNGEMKYLYSLRSIYD